MEPFGLGIRALARSLGVAPSTLSRLVAGSSAVTPEMALRLSKALGRSPDAWLAMQQRHDLWQARRHTDLSAVRRVRFQAA